MINTIYENVERLFAWIGMGLKQDALAYCDIETADSKHVLVGKDGSLVSIIRLDGYKRFVGANEFAFLCERMTELLQPAFTGKGHFLQFYFAQGQNCVKKQIEDTMIPARRTAKRLKLDIDDILDSRAKTLADYCTQEDCFLTLWTTADCLSKAHLKSVSKQHDALIKKSKLPRLKGSQNLSSVYPELRNIHDSFVHTIVEDMQHAGFYLDLMDVHSACHAMRYSVDPEYTHTDWQPYLPGDKLPLKHPPALKKSKKHDISHLAWPRLDAQLMPRGGENLDAKYARVGDLIYAPIYVELFPKDVKPFYDLFRRMLPTNIPWRVSYFLGPDGIEIAKSKRMLAQYLTFASEHNKMLVESHNLLKQLHERSDNPITSFYVCFSTWARFDQLDLLKIRAAKLAKTIQSWGGCETRQISGDAFGSTLSSALAMNKQVYATPSAAPLSDATYMMPFVRPAAPWKQGAIMFRTPDGKLWPYQPGSNQQISWVDLVYAKSGSGKSVLLNSLNLGLCLSAGLSHLPRVSIIDIGPSSKGFISLIKEGLPKEERHQARYHRLTLEEKDAINPFDTNLGARFPTRNHRAFLINFISLLLVENVEDSPPEGTGSMLSMLIDETFKRFSDAEQPKIYVKFVETDIDTLIPTLNLQDDTPSWWQVVDALFAQGHTNLALRAQRRAMPTVADTISIANTNIIHDLFGNIKTQTGENYVECYSRIIASVIRNYPTLTHITNLSLEGARVVAIDLEEVTKSGNAQAQKQTAMMYMLARHILTHHYYQNMEQLKLYPEQYREHHRGHIKSIMEEPKRIVFDEFHRTSKSSAVRDQIQQDMREGRKWKTHIALASQSLKDFDQVMIEFATSIFIMDAGVSVAVDETCKTFGLTETEKVALTTRVHGPTSSGATFIAQFVTNKGMNTQLLTSTISPEELWAFSTTTEDVYVRDRLYEQINPVTTRRLLAKKFPKGSVLPHIQGALKLDPELTISEICEKIINEILTHNYQEQRILDIQD